MPTPRSDLRIPGDLGFDKDITTREVLFLVAFVIACSGGLLWSGLKILGVIA